MQRAAVTATVARNRRRINMENISAVYGYRLVGWGLTALSAQTGYIVP